MSSLLDPKRVELPAASRMAEIFEAPGMNLPGAWLEIWVNHRIGYLHLVNRVEAIVWKEASRCQFAHLASTSGGNIASRRFIDKARGRL
jgi:hypothetical protein